MSMNREDPFEEAILAKKRKTKIITAASASFILLACVVFFAAWLNSPEKACNDFYTFQKYNQWDRVWEMLHPDDQAYWDSEAKLASVYKQWPLKDFKIGRASMLPNWAGPRGSAEYHDAAEMPLTRYYSSATGGEITRSSMIHSVKDNGQWRFFLNKQ